MDFDSDSPLTELSSTDGLDAEGEPEDQVVGETSSSPTKVLATTLAQFAFKPSEKKPTRPSAKPGSSKVEVVLEAKSSAWKRAWIEASKTSSPKRRKTSEGFIDPEAEGSESERASTSDNLPKSNAAKSKRKRRDYAPPEKYSHLPFLMDRVKPGLDILFCGINPGLESARRGFHFAHPTNQFYRALHESGLTDVRLKPEQSPSMPERYNYGITDLVDRPSASLSELSQVELQAGVPVLLHKISQLRPRIVCFIGIDIGKKFTDAIERHNKQTSRAAGSKIKKEIVKKQKRDEETIPKDGTPVKGEPSTFTKQEDRKPSTNRKDPDYVSLALSKPGFGLLPYKMVHLKEGKPKIETEEDIKPSLTVNDDIIETLFFTQISTSGGVTNYYIEDRVQLFKALKELNEAVKAGNKDTRTGFTVIPRSLYEGKVEM
ncbi:hypothetical protein FRC03_004779 [Tulasnella sp. 419]|nr:hypothetical protein FRC03_004779 [Tulasnella sp. 419]